MSKQLRNIFGFRFAPAFCFKANLCFLLVVLAPLAKADTYAETFSQFSDVYQSQMVWNLSLHELHPPLLIAGWDSGSGAQNTSYSVGTGQDGDFVPARYSLFGTVVGSVITIDTDVHSNLQFTSFHLAAGYTLSPVGSKPLVIRSQSTVLVDGAIDCSGASGLSAVSSMTTSRTGAVGRCGGGNGGASVAAGQAPAIANQGSHGGVSVTGGAGGPQAVFVSGGEGGGGGGGYVKSFVAAGDKPDPTPGGDSNGGPGGVVGSIFQDDGFVNDLAGAGSGGGGGSAYDLANVAGRSSGASGGAGGGNIQIYAVQGVTISATGSIRANGGVGGSVTAPFIGGAGGGGAGGSVLIFAGGIIDTTGPVTASSGAGGASPGGSGGNGSWGRTWIVASTGYATLGSPEDPVSNLANPGVAQYETGVTYTVTSAALDLGSSLPTISAIPAPVIANQGAATLLYQWAFSASNDPTSFSGYALGSTYLGKQVPRYGSFQIQLNNTSAVTPVTISSLDLTFDSYIQNKFTFTTGCGGDKGAKVAALSREALSPSTADLAGFISAPFFILPFVALYFFRRRR